MHAHDRYQWKPFLRVRQLNIFVKQQQTKKKKKKKKKRGEEEETLTRMFAEEMYSSYYSIPGPDVKRTDFYMISCFIFFQCFPLKLRKKKKTSRDVQSLNSVTI